MGTEAVVIPEKSGTDEERRVEECQGSYRSFQFKNGGEALNFLNPGLLNGGIFKRRFLDSLDRKGKPQILFVKHNFRKRSCKEPKAETNNEVSSQDIVI